MSVANHGQRPDATLPTTSKFTPRLSSKTSHPKGRKATVGPRKPARERRSLLAAIDVDPRRSADRASRMPPEGVRALPHSGRCADPGDAGCDRRRHRKALRGCPSSRAKGSTRAFRAQVDEDARLGAAARRPPSARRPRVDRGRPLGVPRTTSLSSPRRARPLRAPADRPRVDPQEGLPATARLARGARSSVHDPRDLHGLRAARR